MIRSEIQKKTGLTRKAIEYYEKKGLIHPEKSNNGYREYRKEDVEILNQVVLCRKLGLSVPEIEQYIASGRDALSSIARKKQHQLDMDHKRNEILELMIKGEDPEEIQKKISLLQTNETMFDKLEAVFPGYFGQMMFAAYKPFLDEPLQDHAKEAFYEYITYLDSLPEFELSEEESNYIEKVSSTYDMDSLQQINQAKLDAVDHAEEWMIENKEWILEYEKMKHSEEYQNSMLKKIQDKLSVYMQENRYYEIAIPLIRKFSKSYDEYYQKLLKANETFIKLR